MGNWRVLLIVLDSVGIGGAIDAAEFGDEGSNTLGNTARSVGGLNLPNLGKMGLGNLTEIKGIPPVSDTIGAYGRMQERSRGKDTTTGHWEIAGLILDRSFPTYPNGFPDDVIAAFEKAIGRKVLGNRAASGTVILEELGEEHLATGKPIVYTSADSVFQIAAHEEKVSVEELYDMCKVARRLLQGEHGVGRVIARPFTGQPGNFVRTAARKDFSLEPPRPTILDNLVEKGVDVLAVGKINDIFAGRGITRSVSTKNNMETVDRSLEYLDQADAPALIFANCVDFDSMYGHRNDPVGYAGALEEFDRRLPEIFKTLRPDDLLMIVADHGCDPTTESTDHSREQVPLLVAGQRVKAGTDLGLRDTFADVAATLADLFDAPPTEAGQSFWDDIKTR